MRLYRIDRRSQPGSRWTGTQDEARKLAKETGGPWEQVDVPTDKEGLLGFLNFEGAVATEISELNGELGKPEFEGFLSFAEIDADPRYNNAAPAPQLPKPTPRTADGIVDFLLTDATQAEVESIFAAIGCRWGEARRAA